MATDNLSLIDQVSSAGKTLTPPRLSIFRALEALGRPITAYELQGYINDQSDESFNISTIYRVLDFWVDLGFVHKLESANKFVLCTDEHRNHIHVLQHCNNCHSVEESCDVSRMIKMPISSSFKPDSNQVIEIQGRCQKCSR